ncbi:MAG TPA: hypothetical protein VEL31_24270 [Ktedonobacteraceae bacterium]|nr:hypothetical protein [Ktedonobacteraceae bacterium]
MQQLASRPRPDMQVNNGGAPRSQIILIVALLLFSAAGLTSGFFIGAMTRPQQQKQSANTQTGIVSQSSPIGPKATATQAPATNIVPLGYPVTTVPFNQVADGTTQYTVTAYPVDQSIDKGHGKPVHATNITCKLFFTKEKNITNALLGARDDRLKNVNTLSQPLPEEESGVLLFNGTQQTKNCAAQGNTTWTYQLTPTLKAGIYYLVVLMDWEGQRFNWYQSEINVTKP